MMTLFTPPGLDVDGGHVTKMDSVCADQGRRSSKYGSCYWGDECDDGDDDDDEEEETDSSSAGSEEDSATVRKVCQLWKSKRRKEKLKIVELK